MSKNRRDMTSGSEWKEILLFSLPIMLGQFLQQLYNTVDGIVVGRYGGATEAECQNALAAVGGGVSLIFLFLAICIGLGNGGGVQISQLYGARRYDELKRAASTQIIAMGTLGAILMVIGIAFVRPMLAVLMDIRDPEILELSIDYYGIYAGGLVFVYLYNAVSCNLRAIGDSRSTLYFLIVSAVLNTILDLVFVIVFGWGVAGVAIATVISQGVSCAVSFVYMFKKYPVFRFGKGEFVFDRERFRVSLRLGVPAIIQQAVVSVGNVFIQRLVNLLDVQGAMHGALMSAFTVGNRMENYALVPIFGLNMGVATFTGQNVGAGKLDRVKRGWKSTILMTTCASLLISLVVYFIAPEFAVLFGATPEAQAIAVEFQRFMSLVIVLFAAYMPTSGTLQGAGDAMWSTAASIGTLAARVMSAYALVYWFDWGYGAVWQTMPVGWCFGIIITYARFFSGRWKSKAIVTGPAEDAGDLEELF